LALKSGYDLLEKGGSSIDAVQAAVMSLEDCPLFTQAAVLFLPMMAVTKWMLNHGWKKIRSRCSSKLNNI